MPRTLLALLPLALLGLHSPTAAACAMRYEPPPQRQIAEVAAPVPAAPAPPVTLDDLLADIDGAGEAEAPTPTPVPVTPAEEGAPADEADPQS